MSFRASPTVCLELRAVKDAFFSFSSFPRFCSYQQFSKISHSSNTSQNVFEIEIRRPFGYPKDALFDFGIGDQFWSIFHFRRFAKSDEITILFETTNIPDTISFDQNSIKNPCDSFYGHHVLWFWTALNSFRAICSMHFDSIVSNFSGRFKIDFRRNLEGVAYDSVQI